MTMQVRAGDDVRAVVTALAYRTDRWHLGEHRWPEPWRAAH